MSHLSSRPHAPWLELVLAITSAHCLGPGSIFGDFAECSAICHQSSRASGCGRLVGRGISDHGLHSVRNTRISPYNYMFHQTHADDAVAAINLGLDTLPQTSRGLAGRNRG